MTNTIAERQQEIVDEFEAIDNWRDRYRRIIELGRELPGLAEELKTDKFKVRGCQSQVWLHADLDDGRVVYTADSDAAIVRGLIAIVLRVYSDQPPGAIVDSEPTFIDSIGLSQHLSQTRANGLSAMLKQIKMYAFAMQALASRAS